VCRLPTYPERGSGAAGPRLKHARIEFNRASFSYTISIYSRPDTEVIPRAAAVLAAPHQEVEPFPLSQGENAEGRKKK